MKPLFAAIGDSFVVPSTHAKGYKPGEHFWLDIIERENPKFDYFSSGLASRDTQTIIDIWIKLLPNLKETDYLTIILPFFKRTRLPLAKSEWNISVNLGQKDTRRYDIRNMFIGTASYNEGNNLLEFWGKEHNQKYYLDNLEFQEIINASKASQINFIEVIKSLKEITKAHTYIISWDRMDYKSDDIDDRDKITKELGKWETLWNDWDNSNGELGIQYDEHLGLEMHKSMAKFILQKHGIL